ncbi:hypothetical protein [Streptomyces sp. NPDC059883]|uniref:hypothetical protein n=1 Tax=unclassified Streptomyces TaxID=2593676 RepID=UPI003653643C
MTETHTQPSGDAREILLNIAGRLASVRPTHVFDDARRMAMILTAATAKHGYMSTAADELEAEVLRFAPAIERGREVTRGEYSLLLRKAAGGAQ